MRSPKRGVALVVGLVALLSIALPAVAQATEKKLTVMTGTSIWAPGWTTW
jgi:hypothetical protein